MRLFMTIAIGPVAMVVYADSISADAFKSPPRVFAPHVWWRWKKTDRLLPSGPLGPVALVVNRPRKAQ